MRAEDAYRIFVLVNIKNKVLLDLFISFHLFLSLYLGIAPTIFDISVCDYLNLSNSVFMKMISDFKVSDKVIRLGIYDIDFAVVFDEAIRKEQLSFFCCFLGMNVIGC
jgi:hypothetical protein